MEDKNEDSESTENPDTSTVVEKTEDSQATEAASEDGKGEDSKATEEFKITTGEPESGTGGCQRITNSFEIFFLFWILASLVDGSEKLRRMWRTYNIKPVIILDVKSNATKHELNV